MFNRILAAAERGLPAAGVVAASGGNAGLAAAYAARELGVPAEVFVPVTAPPVKVAKLAKLGARVVQVGSEYAEAYAAAVVHAEVTGALFCHAYDDPDMVAGNGTLGLELVEQLPDGFDTVLVAVGGGGLIAGVAAALHGTPGSSRSSRTPAAALHAALSAGGPVDVPVSGVAADSLGARRVGDDRLRTAVATAAAVGAGGRPGDRGGPAAAVGGLPDRGRARHRRRLGRADLRRLPAGRGERVVVLLCGANTDPADLGTA